MNTLSRTTSCASRATAASSPAQQVKALDDLGAGAALTLRGLAADGETIIEDAWQIGRGYDGFVDKEKGSKSNTT